MGVWEEDEEGEEEEEEKRWILRESGSIFFFQISFKFRSRQDDWLDHSISIE